jgi:hypothetical protein
MHGSMNIKWRDIVVRAPKGAGIRSELKEEVYEQGKEGN